MNGTHPVLDLAETDDSIGKMDKICQDCGAFKFEKETGSTCCNNGKVRLNPFHRPPDQINKLWHDDTVEGRLFRQNARVINNAVCLTSIKVRVRNFAGGFTPCVVFQGKVNYLAGPLQAADGERPCFVQLYVHDQSLETSTRFNNMTVPAGMSKTQKRFLEGIMTKGQDDLHRNNP